MEKPYESAGFDDKSNEGYNTNDDGGEADEMEEIAEEPEEATPRDTLARARKKLAECRKERQEYLDGWQRARAELANLSREKERAIAERATRERDAALAEILPALDSFELARGEAVWQNAPREWREGVENIHAQLTTALGRLGVCAFDSLGEAFDPSRHEPMQSRPVADEREDNTVVEVLQRGYTSGERVLRPAKVIVGEYRGKEGEEKEAAR